MRAVIVTSRAARRLIEKILERAPQSPGMPEVVVVDLPVPAISLVPARSIARLLLRRLGKPGPGDVVIIPGLSPGRAAEAEEILGVPVVRGPRDPGLLPYMLRDLEWILSRGRAEREIPYEDLGRATGAAVLEGLSSVEPAFSIRGLRVPRRGPPMLLAAEIPPGTLPERAGGEARRILSEGADILVAGASPGEPDEAIVERARALAQVRAPLICELPRPGLAQPLLAAGCSGFSLSAEAALRLEGLPEETVLVVGDRDLERLGRALERLRAAGLEKLIADPVVGVPLVDYTETPLRYREAQRLGAPLLYSAANAVTDLSSDPHGALALLAAEAAELGASVFLVVEDGPKTRHSTAEAKEALRLASAASALGRPPRDPGSRLLVLRQEHPPTGLEEPPGAVRVEHRVHPVLEDASFIIGVDHEKGLIVVEYRRGRERRAWSGREPKSLMRAILRSVEVSREHAGYLGWELHKAWLALRLGRTYVQDRCLLELPWE